MNMVRLFKMPRPRPAPEELEAAGADAIRQYKRSELMRTLLLCGSMAGLIGIGMLAEYLLTRP
jgi:hypothetical protein